MTTSSDARNPVEALAEEFLDRKRRGEQPTLREYVERYPELAEDIRDLFPALLMMEDLGESSGGPTGPLAADNGAAVGVRLQRLGDYRILREIGRGGMGVVYEAEQESLGRRVALKVLSASSLLDPKQVSRFEREAKAAAKLHHTNIVPVFGVGRQDGHYYFVMQFISGLGLDVVLDDLRRLRGGKPEARPAAEMSRIAGLTGADVARSLLTGRFDADGPPEDVSVTEPCDDAASAAVNGPPADSGVSKVILPGSSDLSASSDPDRQFYRSVARIGVQVAEALEYANRQGILHRDVKPSNLLLDNHGNVWVADFGLAKTAEADDLTHTGDILGTIRYMAPERFSGHCDARSDVYSLGLTLYELVALRPAYEAADRHTLMDRVLHEEPERLKKLAPNVPRDLETIIAKATARDPAARYTTAAALAEDLKRYVEDRPIRARRVSAAERFARWCKRNPVVAGSIGVAATALVAVAVLALIHANRQAEATRRITGLASDLEERGKALETSLALSNSRLARLDLERGRASFEKGQIGVGMLWTVESLWMATEAKDEAGKHVALANLSAWRCHLVELKEVLSHADMVYSVAFSPDGKMIATGSWDNSARLWDAATGRPLGQPLEHSGHVFGVAFSPDGKTIVTASGDKTARLWDVVTCRPRGQPLSHGGEAWTPAFSPDGKIVVTSSNDKTVRFWDAATGRLLGQPTVHSGYVYAVAFSPDGRTILTGGSDNTARLWDVTTRRPLGPPLEHSGWVRCAAFSPNGKTILTGSWDKTARQWDAATGRPIGPPLEHSGRVDAVAFSPDGKTILTGCDDNTAQRWDAATGQRLGRALEHQGSVVAVAFSPDGRRILTGSRDGTARLWDGEVGQPIGRLLDYGSPVWSVAFSRNGRTILTGSRDGQVRLWDVASGHRIGLTVEVESSINAIALSPDGTTILTASMNRTRLWDVATGLPLGQPMEHSDYYVNSVAFSPDGKTILTGCSDTAARLWDAATGQPLGQPLKHKDWVRAVAFSPDGKTILTGSHDNTARLWDASTGNPIGQPLPHSGWVVSMAFSPDGKTVLTGSSDKTARRWDAATGRPIGPVLANSSSVLSVAFSPDGRTIITGCQDQTARRWDAATGQPIGPPMLNSGSQVAFSPDDRLLLTSDSSTARLWEAPAPLPDDVPRLAAWVEAATGLELDERGSIRVLDRAAWLERRTRLEQLGGPPPADPAPRLDPILFGDKPEARGDGWKEKGFWDRAEAAYAEAIHARPLIVSLRQTLARFQIDRGHPDRAAATLEEAFRMMPEDFELGCHLGRMRLWMGDLAGWRKLNGELLDRFGRTNNFNRANEVAWVCSLGPDGAADPQAPIRLAEVAVRNRPNSPNVLNTLAAALYRAGRFDDAIRRLEEAIRLRGGAIKPDDWPLLALAHHRLGHDDQARQWLARLREHEPSTDPSQFWNELAIRLLRSEAEAVVLYDPIFPADPFAP